MKQESQLLGFGAMAATLTQILAQALDITPAFALAFVSVLLAVALVAQEDAEARGVVVAGRSVVIALNIFLLGAGTTGAAVATESRARSTGVLVSGAPIWAASAFGQEEDESKDGRETGPPSGPERPIIRPIFNIEF